MTTTNTIKISTPNPSLTSLLSQYISHHKLPQIKKLASSAALTQLPRPDASSSSTNDALLDVIASNLPRLQHLRILLRKMRDIHDITLEMQSYDMHERHCADEKGTEQQSGAATTSVSLVSKSHFTTRMHLLGRLKQAMTQFESLITTSLSLSPSQILITREFHRFYEREKRHLERESGRKIERLFEVRHTVELSEKNHTNEDNVLRIVLPLHEDAFMIHLFQHRNVYWNNILNRLRGHLEETLREFDPEGRYHMDVVETDSDHIIELRVLNDRSESSKNHDSSLKMRGCSSQSHVTLELMRNNLGVLTRLIETLLDFLPTNSEEDNSLISRFVDSVIGPTLLTGFESIVDWQISHMDVHDTQKLQQFQTLVEEFVKRLHAVLNHQQLDSLQHIEEEYHNHTTHTCIRKRCSFSLKFVRKALVENYSKMVEDASLASNPQSLFYFPRCTVSKGVQILVKECEQLFQASFTPFDKEPSTKDSQPLPDDCIKMILSCAMDSFHLFRILIPSTYSREFTNKENPQRCMEFYCNCMYIGHHISLLHCTYQQHHDLVKRLHLPEFAAQIKHLGASHFQKQYQIQEDDLRAIISSIKGFHDISSKYDQIEQKMNQLTKKLNNLSVHLKPLPHLMYISTFGTLVSQCMKYISEEILKVDDIGADECQLIQHVLQPVAEFAQDWFGLEMVSKLVPGFGRFQSIIAILSLPLVEIAPKFHLGHLAGLSVDDVVHMIKALFSSTVKRSQAIYDVQHGE